MIEAISPATTRADQAGRKGQGDPFAPGSAFPAALAALTDKPGVPERRPKADPPEFGKSVNLAAIAAHELTTPGTPRAEVAAAREEMSSPAERPPVSEEAPRHGADAGSRNAASSPPVAATATVHGRTAPDGEPAPAGDPGQSPDRSAKAAKGDSAPTQVRAACGPLKPVPESSASAFAIPVSQAAVSSPTTSAQPGAVRAVEGLGGRSSSPVSVFKAPAAPRQPGTPQEAFAAQLKRGLAAVLRQNGGSVTVRMAPASLGQVRIRLDLDQGQVSARFDVGGPEARRLLESDLGVLRQTLEARGLRVDDLQVTVRPELAGPREPPVDPGGHPASESPEEQDANPGGAGQDHRGGGVPPDAQAPRQDAEGASGPESPTIDPWVSLIGGADADPDGPSVLRLRIDALA